jgi:hypothetical protein
MKVETMSWSTAARRQLDDNSTRKRKSRNDIKYFLKPVLPHKDRSHHDELHAESWALYKATAKKDK